MNEVVSPCISICKMNPDTNFCIGCWRSRSEIDDWNDASDDQRWEIIRNMHKRRKEAKSI